MKILFLDFDGVLNDSSHYQLTEDLWENYNKKIYYESRNSIYDILKKYDNTDIALSMVSDLEYDKVMLLNRIVRDTDCKIVFSTSWRGHGTENLALFLALVGFTYPKSCIDRTPRLKDRGEEITKWLEINKGKWSEYAILDDELFDILDHHPDEKLFQTDGLNFGLTPEIANDIIKYFNKEK